MDFPVRNFFFGSRCIPFNWYWDCFFFSFLFPCYLILLLAWVWMFSYFKQAMQIFPHKLHCRYIYGRFFISFSYLKSSAMTKDRNNFKDLHRYFKKWMNGRSECESLIISQIKRKARVFIDLYAVGWWICIESYLEWPNLLHRSSYLKIVCLM